jgi:hypothetical protein
MGGGGFSSRRDAKGLILLHRYLHRERPDPGIFENAAMNASDIPSLRLASQQLGHATMSTPEGMVRWLGAVQAQDYEGGLWSIGLRLPGSTRREVEKALDDRKIVRTWAMRGTLHMVPADDVRWVLSLVAPIIIRRSSRREKELGLTTEDFQNGRELITGALEGGRNMTRPEIYRVLAEGGVSPEGQRGYYILFRLALEAVICFGSRRVKEHTFVLLDEWVKASSDPGRDEALADLARRYFTSHGPATLQDFTWWSSLPAADAREGMAALGGEIMRHEVGKKTLFSAAGQGSYPGREAHLLPPYDEFFIAYRDRTAFINPADLARIETRLSSFPFIIGGRAAGTWKKEPRKEAMVIRTRSFARLEQGDVNALDAAVGRYAAYLGIHGEHRHEGDPLSS